MLRNGHLESEDASPSLDERLNTEGVSRDHAISSEFKRNMKTLRRQGLD